MANYTDAGGAESLIGSHRPCRDGLEGPRAPRRDELGAVLDLVNSTFDPVGRTMQLQFPQLLSDANLARLRVFADLRTGLPVAHAGYVRCELVVEGCRIPAAALGSVCTLPTYRGMGLASELTESLMEQAAAEGLVMMVISGGSNVYRRLGATDTGRFVRVEAGPEHTSSLKRAVLNWSMYSRFAARLGSEYDIPMMACIYRREPVRYARSFADFRELTWWRHDTPRLGSLERTWLGGLAGDACGQDGGAGRVESGDLAYVIVRIRAADDAGVRLHVVEFAGARWCVLRLIARAGAEYGPEVVTMTVPASDLEMTALMRRAGLPLRSVSLPEHTIMSLDDHGLIECMSPIIAERFGAGWTALSPPPKGPDLIRWLFTDLGIPLPVPGLNYV
jgi:predicted N-acetyltransferase YhbS